MMNIVSEVVLNLILVMFPCLVYFIYNCYRELKGDEYNELLLNVALVSSVYLVFKYGSVNSNSLGLLFCNLPIVVAYLKKMPGVALLLSLIVIIVTTNDFSIIVGLLVLKYLCYFFIYL